MGNSQADLMWKKHDSFRFSVFDTFSCVALDSHPGGGAHPLLLVEQV
jgi:hypothetical protein